MTAASPRTPAEPARLRGIALILTAVMIFACLDTTAKYLGRLYPVPGLVWARYMVHMLLMAAVLGPHMRWRLIRSAHPLAQVGRSLLLLASTYFFFNALRFMPLAQAAAIGFVSPLAVTALSVPLLGEKVGIRRWSAVIVGFLGVLVILRPGGGMLTMAALLPLGSALTYSFYQIITRKLSATEDPLATLFYTALVGAAGTTLALPLGFAMPQGWHIVLVAAMGVFGGLGHFLLIKAFRDAPASLLAPFSYSQLLYSTVFGYLVFGDFPDAWALVGMAIIVASGIYVGYRESIRARQERAA
ncbi:MAG TPA: DMT family transporter [Candidatus Cybelea sp.]|nr:DMT family transporter [Candidatus Cybelea sp.]